MSSDGSYFLFFAIRSNFAGDIGRAPKCHCDGFSPKQSQWLQTFFFLGTEIASSAFGLLATTFGLANGRTRKNSHDAKNKKPNSKIVDMVREAWFNEET